LFLLVILKLLYLWNSFFLEVMCFNFVSRNCSQSSITFKFIVNSSVKSWNLYRTQRKRKEIYINLMKSLTYIYVMLDGKSQYYFLNNNFYAPMLPTTLLWRLYVIVSIIDFK
jgi:hypothetical protein